MVNFWGDDTGSSIRNDFAAIEKMETTGCYPSSTDTCTGAESGGRIMEVVDGIFDELGRETHGERSVSEIQGYKHFVTLCKRAQGEAFNYLQACTNFILEPIGSSLIMHANGICNAPLS